MDSLLILVKTIPVAFMALMPVINPIGTAIVLLSLTDGADDLVRRSLAKSVAINTVILLTGLLLGGSYVLAFFGISVPIVQVAGGAVLSAMGWRLLNRTDNPNEERSSVSSPGNVDSYASKAFYPYTFPITVGPGGVAVSLTLSAHTTHQTLMDTAMEQAGAFVGFLGIGLVVYLCFAYSNRLAKRLGPQAISVMMRLIAFVVVCIGAQICWTGISTLALSLKS